MIDIYNNLPQASVDCISVSIFRERLTDLARSGASVTNQIGIDLSADEEVLIAVCLITTSLCTSQRLNDFSIQRGQNGFADLC